MTRQIVLVNSDSRFADFIRQATDAFRKYRYVEFAWHTGRQRTSTQNRALHLWCRLAADTLNDAGLECYIDIPGTGRRMSVPWNKDSVKDSIWRPVQIAMTGKESTTEPERQDYAKIHEVICARIAESFGVALPEWPHRPQQEGDPNA